MLSDDGTVLRSDVGGDVLADVRLGDDDGVPSVSVAPRAAAEDGARAGAEAVARQVVRDLAGRRLETPDESLAAALLERGLALRRAATDLRHDLCHVADVTLPDGWRLAAPGFDDDVLAAVTAAYGPGHVEGGWTASDTDEVRAVFAGTGEVPPLVPASARLLDPAGRGVGHVLCAGPAPWREAVCAWVMNLAVAPQAQGRGGGRALLVHALHGTRSAGLPALELSVADGNPARRLYDGLGFRPLARTFTIDLPG